MPYKSKKQKRLMQAVAHNPKFAHKVGISQSVGQKFEAHDDGRIHKARGGYLSRLAAKPKVPGSHTSMLEATDKLIKGTADRLGALRLGRIRVRGK